LTNENRGSKEESEDEESKVDGKEVLDGTDYKYINHKSANLLNQMLPSANN